MQRIIWCLVLGLFAIPAFDSQTLAEEPQSGAAPSSAQPAPANGAIPDVVYIDPVDFVPEPLRKHITVEFRGTPLNEACAEIAEKIGADITIDEQALTEQGIDASEAVTGDSADEPAYLLLDRMLEYVRGVRLEWLVENGALRITTGEAHDDINITRVYNVRALLAQGLSMDDVMACIQSCTSGSWFHCDGIGGNPAEFGDVLLVKQSQRVQREVAALLVALRTPGRERQVGAPSIHRELEQRLERSVTLEFDDVPLSAVVDHLSQEYGLRIAIDHQALSDQGISADEAVSVNVRNVKLRSALNRLLENVVGIRLRIVPSNGQLCITTKEIADDTYFTVVYDVSDLAGHDAFRLEQLIDALKQSSEHNWEGIWRDSGFGTITKLPQIGTFVARFNSSALEEMHQTLASLRASISPPGTPDLPDESDEISTEYFRMDAETARDLVSLLPELVAPGTWKSTMDADGRLVDLQPDGIGVIRIAAAGRVVIDDPPLPKPDEPEKQAEEADDATAVHPETAPTPRAGVHEVVPQTVLIITHRRGVLAEVSKVLGKLSTPAWREGEQGGWRFIPPSNIQDYDDESGFGFGGGFYSVSP